ncbi:unnamed protein product, partial [Symbiodinium sp. CCMP2456]
IHKPCRCDGWLPKRSQCPLPCARRTLPGHLGGRPCQLRLALRACTEFRAVPGAADFHRGQSLAECHLHGQQHSAGSVKS